MVLLGDVGQVESRFGLLGASVGSQCRSKIGARLAPNIPLARKSFWTHPMVLLGDVGHVESCFGPLGASVGAR